MIAPNMATMLSFIITDIKISYAILQKITSNLSDKTFNSITVDSDTSTSDMVLVSTTSSANMKPIKKFSDNRIKQFSKTLELVMKELAIELGFFFPYLYDETQEVAKSFKAACTPEFYLFNNEKTLEYRGRLDNSSPGNGIEPSGIDLRDAIEKLLNGKEVNQAQHPSMGCNIKWK